MRPPRIAEALVAALFPAGECRDAVLGDLAEEYARRADANGASAAGRWYWREAARTAPHAVPAWFRGVRYREMALLCMLAPAMLVVGQLFQYLLMALVVWSWGTLPDSWNILFAAWRDVVEFRPDLAAMVADAGWIIPIASGYVAARLDRRAPLIGAIAVGLLQVLLGVAVIGVRASAADRALLARIVSVWFACIIVGGIVAVWRAAVIDARDARAERISRIPIH